MRALMAAVIATSLALALTGCRDDESTAADPAPEPTEAGASAAAAPAPTITLEAQSPEPLPSGFDPQQCAILAGVLEDIPRMQTVVGPEELYAAVYAAVVAGDMTPINEAGVEVNTIGARLRDNLDAAAPLVDDVGAELALEGLADYYEDYLAVVAQMMATATSMEQLEGAATDITLSSERLHAQAELDAEMLEEFAEVRCATAIDVYTPPGIAGDA